MDVGAEFALELGRVSRRWRTRLDERLKHMGLNQARWTVLLQLSSSGPASQRELAERVGVEGPSLVRVLDRLEDQGLIARHSCDEDRRIKRIHLTAEAEPVLDEITRISTALRLELLADIPMKNIDVAWQVLKALGDRLER
ncbi:MAG: MarR family transcriptional regulator [Alphaproteobacteria bacterium]|jgi:MarR family transcriptional regulator for hemolysin|nr:MarR family transcriptional regulator [Alphaproteobacteria bacterium]